MGVGICQRLLSRHCFTKRGKLLARVKITRENRRDHMLTTSMYRLIPAMALPTVMSSVINQIYNLADTYFVSQIGTLATGAVGINASLDQMINIVGVFFAMGAGSYISRLLGAKDEKRAQQVFATTIAVSFVFGLLVLIIGKIYVVPLVRFLGAIPEIENYAVDYANYVLYAAPFMATQLVLNHSLRSEGSALYALIGITLGGVLNCGLDPLFIFVLDMGVKGASIATALSKLASFTILLIPYLRKKTLIQINLKCISFSKTIVSEVCKMGAPGLFRSGLQVLAAIMMNRIAGAQFSAATLAAISVTNRIFMTMRSACLGYSQGFQPVAGFNWGAKQYNRVIEGYKFTAKSLVIGISIIGGVMFIFAPAVIGAFTTTDAEMLRIGTLALRTQCITLPFNAWSIVVNSLYSGTGRATGAMVISCTRQGFCFYPLVLTLPRFLGLNGLVAVQPGAEVLSVAITIPLAISMLRRLRKLEDGEILIR